MRENQNNRRGGDTSRVNRNSVSRYGYEKDHQIGYIYRRYGEKYGLIRNEIGTLKMLCEFSDNNETSCDYSNSIRSVCPRDHDDDGILNLFVTVEHHRCFRGYAKKSKLVYRKRVCYFYKRIHIMNTRRHWTCLKRYAFYTTRIV